MNINVEGRSIHLPAEVVDNIVGHLHSDWTSIKNIRLVNRLLNRIATPHITDVWTTPTELFTLPEGVIDYSEHAWPLQATARWPTVKGLTIWTWLTIPPDIKLEDNTTECGSRLKDLLWAPNTRIGSGSAGPKRGVCWGRLVEQPDQFWIVQQWQDSKSWDAYRASLFARDIKDFLIGIAPGCYHTSRCEKMRLSFPAVARKSTLFTGYNEIRTYYFPAYLRLEQREAFQNSLKSRARFMPSSSSDSAGIGPSRWCWLRGMRTFQGRSTVAARFIFSFKSAANEEHHRSLGTCWQRDILVDVHPDVLAAAGVLGSESLHCTFQRGPHN